MHKKQVTLKLAFDKFWKWCNSGQSLSSGGAVNVRGYTLQISHSGKTSPYRIKKEKAKEYFEAVSDGGKCPSAYFNGLINSYRIDKATVPAFRQPLPYYPNTPGVYILSDATGKIL